VRAPLQPVSSPEPETQIEQVVEPIIEPIASISEPVSETEIEEIIDETSEDGMSATLRPITSVLQAIETTAAVKTTTLTPQPVQLIPQKKRGSAPQSKRGEKPEIVETTVLKRVQKLTPLKLTHPVKDSAEEEETDIEDE
jgi:SOS-response transcriptional repressor LexA